MIRTRRRKSRRRYRIYELPYPLPCRQTRRFSVSRWLRSFLMIAIAILLSGCMDYHEVESVGLVSGIGVIAKDDGVKVYLELIEKGRIPSEGEGIQSLSAEGASFGEAISNIVLQDGKQPYFGHAQVLIVDEAMIGELPKIVADLMMHKEVRYDLQIVAARQAITELFEVDEQLRAFDLYELLKRNRYVATSVTMRLLDYLLWQDQTYLLPVITMEDEHPTLKKGALLIRNNETIGEADEAFVSSYLMLGGLFESSVRLVEDNKRQKLLGELSNVHVHYRIKDDAAKIEVKGKLKVAAEDRDHAIRNSIQQSIKTELERFLQENKKLDLIDIAQRFDSTKIFIDQKGSYNKVMVDVKIDVLDASNVRR